MRVGVSVLMRRELRVTIRVGMRLMGSGSNFHKFAREGEGEGEGDGDGEG